MRKLTLMLAGILLAGTCSAQTFQDTAMSFRKLEAKTRAGINYRGFTDTLADIEFSVGEYKLRADSLNRANVQEFENALTVYKVTGIVWRSWIDISGNFEMVEMLAPKFSKDFCPEVAVNYKDGINACLFSMWGKARSFTENLQEVKAPEVPTPPAKATKQTKKQQ